MAETELSRTQVKVIRNGYSLPHLINLQRLLKLTQRAWLTNSSGTFVR